VRAGAARPPSHSVFCSSFPTPPASIDGGEIIFNGRNLLDLKQEELRRIRGNEIAMIFQEPMTSLNPVFTIGNQLMEAIQLHQGLSGTDLRDRAVEMLKLVGIPRAEEVLDEYPHRFSGGMRQRAMIAMALSCNPKLLIADEPTTALDVTIQAQILELMKELSDRIGTAILFITHDLSVIAEMADRVAVMYAGKVVEEADVTTLFHNPQHPIRRGSSTAAPPSRGAGIVSSSSPATYPIRSTCREGAPSTRAVAMQCPSVGRRCPG
jgi:peptide/nickel transport system ATP-binding protein